MITCKPDVRFGGFMPGLLVILAGIQQLSVEFGEDIEVTSGSDGHHLKKPLSRHYKFEAVDIRSHNWDLKRKLAIKTRLEQILGDKFTVLLEDVGLANEHMHIQVRKGLKYP